MFFTMSLFAFSDGWKGSQNAYISLLGHKFDNGVHSPIPLYGPCPQHAIFAVTNPTKTYIKRVINFLIKYALDLAKYISCQVG